MPIQCLHGLRGAFLAPSIFIMFQQSSQVEHLVGNNNVYIETLV